MIDTHAHISDAQFDADRDEMLDRAFSAGVEKIIEVGTSVGESRDALRVARRFNNIYASVAVHPHEYSNLPEKASTDEWIREIEKLASDRKVVAVGECGLDYHEFSGIPVTESHRASQKSGFIAHLEVARRLQKPIVIHARESYNDVFTILHSHVSEIPSVILHCYQGDSVVTRAFLDLDERIAFSFAGNITYPVKKSIAGTKDDIRHSIAMIPLNRMLVETDSPYLAPQAFRGTRNESGYLGETIRMIAEITRRSFEDVEKATSQNAVRYFPGMDG